MYINILLYIHVHVGAVLTSNAAVTAKPPVFLSSQTREKIRKKDMKERNMRYVAKH